MQNSIKHWPEQERPRERLLQQGAQSLSDAELLAIFLRSGSRQHSAVELARQMIQHFGGLSPVFDAELSDLSQFHGMGPSKYSQLMAVKELGRRYLQQYFHQPQLELNSSAQVLDYLRYELLGERQEVLQCSVWIMTCASSVSRNYFWFTESLCRIYQPDFALCLKTACLSSGYCT